MSPLSAKYWHFGARFRHLRKALARKEEFPTWFALSCRVELPIIICPVGRARNGSPNALCAVFACLLKLLELVAYTHVVEKTTLLLQVNKDDLTVDICHDFKQGRCRDPDCPNYHPVTVMM
jgi:hypothetical protein